MTSREYIKLALENSFPEEVKKLSESDLKIMEEKFEAIKVDWIRNANVMAAMLALCSFAYDRDGGVISDTELNFTGGDMWEDIESEMYELNEDLEKDYDSLRLEYNDLVDKYNALEEELFNIKNSKTRDELLANKVREFMLSRG